MEKQITFGPVRYIKLGPKNSSAESAIKNGTLDFGYGGAGHELAAAGDEAGLKDELSRTESSANEVSQVARQILDFYTLGSDCLWITFYDGYLWWASAEPEVTLHGPREGAGDRTRKTIGGWQNTDVQGKPLWIKHLSNQLTQVRLYQRTLCKVHEREYLARKINGTGGNARAKRRRPTRVAERSGGSNAGAVAG